MPGIVTAVEVEVSINSIKYHPKSKPELHPPLAPSVTATAVPAPSRRELWGLYLATLACCLWESANCESLSHGYAVPAPFGKGALRAVPADNFARESSANRYCPDPPGVVTAVQ